MSEQEVILEDKKLKKKLWQQIIDAAKEALEKNDNTKKGIIKKTAELLEKNGMPLEMICGTVTRELNGFASKNYITECLDSKYKNMTQSHPIPRITKPKVEDEVGNVTLPDDTNNNAVEQNSGSPVQDQVNEWYEQTKDTLTAENNTKTIDDLEKPEDQPLFKTVNQVMNSQQLTEEQEEKEEEQQLELEIIRPEDYIIQDLPKYSSQLKDRIIIYLDEQVKRLTKENN